MSGDKKPPIIKKVIKKGHGGHHGGSWKVAYADFVTALMAFFLVMWLLAISSEAGREALADYFNELTMYDAVFNGGLPSAFTEGGARSPSILEGGCFSPRTDGDATVDTDGNPAAAGQIAALIKATQEVIDNLDSLPEGMDGGEGSGDAGRAEDSGDPGPMTEGEQRFAEGLRAEIQGSLGDAATGQVLVEKVKGGLRVQIVDQDGRPMFRSGGPVLTPEAKAILDVVAERLRSIPNKISIEGHTDAVAFSGQRMTNWELSTARASAVRMYLAGNGLDDHRLTSVAGYASTQPLDEKDPGDPINRRVSIMIWDEEPEPPKPGQTPPGAETGQSPGQKTAAPAGPSSQPDGAATPSRPRTATTPPPLPQRPVPPRPQTPAPPEPGLSGEELEHQLIESIMERSAAPDLSTVGPAGPPPSE